jgi:hypothetical protein
MTAFITVPPTAAAEPEPTSVPPPVPLAAAFVLLGTSVVVLNEPPGTPLKSGAESIAVVAVVRITWPAPRAMRHDRLVNRRG